MPGKGKKKRESKNKKKKNTVSPHDAKTNYQTYEDQFVDTVSQLINDGIHEIYKNAYWYCSEPANQDACTMDVFHVLLSEVPNWLPYMIKQESKKITTEIPWFREVLRQMIVQKVNIMVSIKLDRATSIDNFFFELPGNDEIIHRFYTQVAKDLLGFIELYDHTADKTQHANNIYRAQEIIRESLKRCIRTLVPMRALVDQHLCNAAQAAESESSESSSSSYSSSSSHRVKEEEDCDVIPPREVAEQQVKQPEGGEADPNPPLVLLDTEVPMEKEEEGDVPPIIDTSGVNLDDLVYDVQ